MKPAFENNKIYQKYGYASEYISSKKAGKYASLFPSLYFYSALFAGPFRWLVLRARKNQCDDFAWTWSSAWVGELLEHCGCRIVLEGMENFPRDGRPVVYVANHMSTLETFLLPGIIRPYGKVTFVVKQSLVQMPLFGPVMRSRNPVTVARDNPREDLAKVLQEGTQRVRDGFSVIIFPQSTRMRHFSRDHFNTMGIKLARRAAVPIVPIALKTDAWGLGRHIPELGRIRPDLPVRIKIGAPMRIASNGRQEHQEICDFIESSLSRWENKDGTNP